VPLFGSSCYLVVATQRTACGEAQQTLLEPNHSQRNAVKLPKEATEKEIAGYKFLEQAHAQLQIL
jgi:hypothetical protein